MIDYYKEFSFDYNQSKLFNLFQTSSKTQKLMYILADNLPVDVLPCMQIFNRPLLENEYGLSELVSKTGFHVSPRNNGLIVFPVHGRIEFNFIKCKVIATSPIAINGRQMHDYSPLDNPSIFFAIKIPTNISWEEAIKLL
jgi:hypothetical protein